MRPVCGSWIRAPRPASVPVPAVVGTATIGGRSARDPVEPAGRQVVVGERARVGRQQPDRLGRVDRAAAAEADEAVAAPVAVDGRGRPGRRPRSGWPGRRRRPRRAAERPDHLGDEPRRDQARVGDDQRARHAEPGQLAGQLGRAPSPKRMRFGKVKVAGIALGRQVGAAVTGGSSVRGSRVSRRAWRVSRAGRATFHLGRGVPVAPASGPWRSPRGASRRPAPVSPASRYDWPSC